MQSCLWRHRHETLVSSSNITLFYLNKICFFFSFFYYLGTIVNLEMWHTYVDSYIKGAIISYGREKAEELGKWKESLFMEARRLKNLVGERNHYLWKGGGWKFGRWKESLFMDGRRLKNLVVKGIIIYGRGEAEELARWNKKPSDVREGVKEIRQPLIRGRGGNKNQLISYIAMNANLNVA